LTGKILNSFKQRVKGLTLVPGSGGCFEVTVDGELVYSKLKTGEFPNEDALVDKIGSRKKK
jgi:selenoprotein W-related protein